MWEKLQSALGVALLVASNLYLGNVLIRAYTTESLAPVTIHRDVSIDAKPAVVVEVTQEEEADPEARKRRAVVDLALLISVDGLRPDAVFPHARHITRLSLEGTTAVNAKTISKASTLPSHASMVSGVDHDQHGLDFNAYRPERGHIKYPTIFSAAQRAGLATAVFVGKRKLSHLMNPADVGHFEVGGVRCDRVTKLAVPYLETAENGIVFAHLSDPDGAGHRDGWMSKEYGAAVRRADRCVRDLLKALDKRGHLDRTLVLVTSDHGGHDHSHGSRRHVDRHIPWLAWGGPIRSGERVRRPVLNTDTAATILHALGLDLPEDIVGKPVTEAFE